jgi:DNA (cytosine-5)-methyltransferase 1
MIGHQPVLPARPHPGSSLSGQAAYTVDPTVPTYLQLKAEVETWETDSVRVVTLLYLKAAFGAAGYEVTFGIDKDVDACETFSLNHPGTDIECGDITKYSAGDILRRVGDDVDIVVGGPSCQGFSSAGRRLDKQLGWVRVGDERNELWKHQFEIVSGLKPRAFLLENVPGFTSFNKGTFGSAVLAEFERLGYRVSCEILLAANYGLPQLRRRMFIVGVAKGLSVAMRKSPLVAS